MSAPAVSVVIATYNGTRTLPLQLEALATQRDAPPFEVIVVDNGSSDGVTAVAEGWRGRLPGLQVITAAGHQGVSYARNVGIAHAAADKLAFCDDDDVVGPVWVAAADDALDHTDLVTGSVTELPASEFAHGLGPLRSCMDDVAIAPPMAVGVDQRYPILMGGDFAMTRPLALELGGFDQSFVPGAEDNDLGLRYVASGRVMRRADAMQVISRARPDTRGAIKRSFEGGRMHMLLCERHDLWATSPNLHDPFWFADLFRALAAALIMVVRPGKRAWRAVGSRIALRAGQLAGFVRFRLLRRLPPRQLGLGLESPDPLGRG